MVFWMSGFTFPTGFLTAVLQTSARRNNVSVDLLSWEFTVLTVDDSNLTGAPKVPHNASPLTDSDTGVAYET